MTNKIMNMKNRKNMIKVILFSLLIVLTSCTKKTYLSDLRYVEDNETKNLFAYDKNGKPFDGIAWSSDEMTLCLEVDKGIVVLQKAFHENGEIAVISTRSKITYYDNEGNEVSAKDSKKHITPEILARIRMAGYEMGFIDD